MALMLVCRRSGLFYKAVNTLYYVALTVGERNMKTEHWRNDKNSFQPRDSERHALVSFFQINGSSTKFPINIVIAVKRSFLWWLPLRWLYAIWHRVIHPGERGRILLDFRTFPPDYDFYNIHRQETVLIIKTKKGWKWKNRGYKPQSEWSGFDSASNWWSVLDINRIAWTKAVTLCMSSYEGRVNNRQPLLGLKFAGLVDCIASSESFILCHRFLSSAVVSWHTNILRTCLSTRQDKVLYFALNYPDESFF
jgi:hypothetical protein